MKYPFLRVICMYLIALFLILLPLTHGHAANANVGIPVNVPTQQKLRDVILEGIKSCAKDNPSEDKILFRACLKEKIVTFLKERALAKKSARASVKAEVAPSSAPVPSETPLASDAAGDDPFLGDANAPVTVVEFTDVECPYCKRHFDLVFPKINETYIKTGKVKYVLKDFPLSFHQNSMSAAIASNCVLEQAGNDEYFAFHDRIVTDPSGLGEDLYKKVAEELDLNVNWFSQCLQEADPSEINADMEDAKALGLTGVPFFLVGDQVITGSLPFETFESAIEAEILKSGK